MLHQSVCCSDIKSVMMSMGVSSFGRIEVIFIDAGVNINRAYYHEVLPRLTVEHIEMPFAPYDRAMLDARFLCG